MLGWFEITHLIALWIVLHSVQLLLLACNKDIPIVYFHKKSCFMNQLKQVFKMASFYKIITITVHVAFYFVCSINLIKFFHWTVNDDISFNELKKFYLSKGEGSQTHNFHLLRHLTYFVQLFGPLWVYSCFGFEALNGFLTTMIHGTQHISNQVKQIIWKIYITVSCSHWKAWQMNAM